MACVVGVSWNQPAWDLTATYVAGRLVASGQAVSLYDQARENSALRPHSAWATAAEAGGIADHVVTPYVQTPLWAYLVAPFAASVKFGTFKRFFAGLSACAVAAMIYLAALQWTPALASPAWQAGLLFGLFLGVPFDAGLALGQTHALFIFLAIWAAVSNLRGRGALAGVLLAGATAVKITPFWMALTWLVAGYRRSFASFTVTSALLAGLAVCVAGTAVFKDYFHTLERWSGSVVLSYNNDSLACVLLGRLLTPNRAFRFETLPMPGWVGLLSISAAVSAVVLAGVMDRALTDKPNRQADAVFTLVAATAFSPLAWNHYYIVLIVPLMLFLDMARARRTWMWLLLAGVVVALNEPPLAYTVGASLDAVSRRSHFWAAMLCLCALPFCSPRPLRIKGASDLRRSCVTFLTIC